VAIVVALFLGISLVSAAAGSFRKTPADKIAISYGGGPFEGNKFQRVVNPSSGLTFNGLFDHWYEYPVTQRNYIVSMHADEGDRGVEDSITASTSDKVQVKYEVAVYFKLNTNKLQHFHETIGLKYNAWTESGWNQMLNDSFRQQLESALQLESRRHDAESLLGDPDAVNAVGAGVATQLKDRIEKVLGDDYFCGPTFVRGQKSCPNFTVVLKRPSFSQAVLDAFEANRISKSKVITAQNEADAKEAEARGVARQRQALDQGGALSQSFIDYTRAQAELACAQRDNCTMVVTPGNTNVNVNNK
jgi:regulator of protease activity HflC (stomatin/prohibitin superfamily)